MDHEYVMDHATVALLEERVRVIYLTAPEVGFHDAIQLSIAVSLQRIVVALETLLKRDHRR